MKELYCKVYGNVQGIFFRKFAEEKAEALGITGYAKNLEDGTVEVVAQGPEADLRTYLSYISVGPEHGEVDSIDIQWGPVEIKESGFRII